MLATLYNVAVDLPLQESGWAVAFLWLCRCLYLFSYIRCYCCNGCCAGAPCAACNCGGPTQFQVVVSGVADDSCSECDQFDNTYVLDRGSSACTTEGTVGANTTCNWSYALPSTICSGSIEAWRKTYIDLWLVYNSTGNTSALHVNFYTATVCTRNFEYWTGGSVAGTLDCCALNESVPLFAGSGSGVCSPSSNAVVTTVV
jgi:hypothetical protein